MSARDLERIGGEIVGCRSCPRLVEWRERVARDKTARFADQTYWGRPVPGFGDPAARILVVGLAPAAHGGNRTGRIFTGDRSGDFLFGSLHRVGLSNQLTSVSLDDGLRLTRTYLSAVNRCAPPDNKPTPVERDTCLPYLQREIAALGRLRVLVALGGFAWDGALRALSALGHTTRPRPRFRHAAEASVGPFVLLGSYHPSQQNTFTGKLTPPMLDAVFERAAQLAG
jgi:uracil-DNA glycosylase family 4